MHGEKWHLASRGVAAHSAFGFDADMSDPFLRSGLAARVLGHRLKPENWHVTCRRVEDTTGVWLETSHDQFAASHGVRYNRRLFVDTTGEDLRGEDMLMPASSKANISPHVSICAFICTRRFRHPASRRFQRIAGVAWRSWLAVSLCAASRPDLKIEESVFMGDDGIPSDASKLQSPAHCSRKIPK